MPAGTFRRTHLKLDMRSVASQTKADADYPYLVFRRITSSENNQVNYARERIEIEVIGLKGSAAKGDDLLEAMRTALIDKFGGKSGRWGAYAADGTPDPAGGLSMKGIYLSTVEAYSQELDEKVHVLIFLFAYLRGA